MKHTDIKEILKDASFSMDHRAESRYNGNMASKRRRGLGKCKRGRIWICGYRWDVSFLPEYDS